MNIINFLISKNKTSLNRIAVIEFEKDRSITYQELWDNVNLLSKKLVSLGLKAGDRVAMAMPNSIDWIISFLAVLKCGGIVAPIKQSATAYEIKNLIMNSKPDLFIGDSAFINRSLPFDLVNDSQIVTVLSKRLIIKNRLNKRINNLEAFIHESAPDSDQKFYPDDESNVATINYTYKGYGYPLGVLLSHYNYIEGIKAYIATAEFNEKHVFLSILPFSYIYPLIGCLLTPLATSSTIILYNGISPNKIWDIINNNKVDVLTAVPSIYSLLLETYKSGSSTSFAFCGGSLMPIDLYTRFEKKTNIPLRQGYGLTESLPVSCNPIKDNRPETLGRILIGSERKILVKIVDEEGYELENGEVGEIVISGPTVMRGYYKRPKETAVALRKGWLYTGDWGSFDNEYLVFKGLKKRITKVAGNMVDLLEVEHRILRGPYVKSVNVYPVKDDRWGEIIAADVVPFNRSFETKLLKQYLKKYLATYKLPKIFKVCQ